MPKILIKGKTAAQWAASSEVLASREPAVATDTGIQKIGDGVHTWATLPVDSRLTDKRVSPDASITEAQLTTAVANKLNSAAGPSGTPLAGQVGFRDNSNNFVWTAASAVVAQSLNWKIATDPAYGADATGAVDSTTALQACLDAAATANTTAYAAGVFKTSSTLTATSDMEFGRATINYSGTSTALQIGSGSVLFSKDFILPKLVATAKTTTGWTQVIGSVGVKIINANTCYIKTSRITNFETGRYLYGQGSGTTYCTLVGGYLENNKRNEVLDANSTGWCNQNTFVGGRYGHTAAEGTAVTDVRHVLCTTGLSNPINNNYWLNSSFEGNVPEFQLDAAGSSNVWQSCRWEVTGGGRVRWQADCTDNVIREGYKAESIVFTDQSAASGRNKLQSGNKWEFAGSTTTGVVRIQNVSSDASPAFRIFGAASRADTDYRWNWTANQLEGKRVAESFARVVLDGNNGRLYLGNGTVTPAMYVAGVGTSGWGLYGGNLYSGTDNTYDIGLINSLRYRYIRAGTSLVTGSGATSSRPAVATAGAGAVYYDTDINSPVWSNGSAWTPGHLAHNTNGRVVIQIDTIAGSDPTGTTTNDAAIATAHSLVPSSGAIIEFGAGTYNFSPASTAAIVLQKSNVTYRGAGRGLTTLVRTGSTLPLIRSSGSYTNLRNITIEDMTLDWNAESFPSTQPNNGVAVGLYGAHLNNIRMHRVHLNRPPQYGIFCDGLTGIHFEDVSARAPGDCRGNLMWLQNACSGVVVRPRSHWLYDGIRIVSSSGSTTTSDPSKRIEIVDYEVEGGWYLNLAQSVKVGAVTYTSTGITDDGASFPTTVNVTGEAADFVRVMPTLRTNSGATVTYSKTSITDSAASFVTDGVQEGHIIRAGSCFAVVADVNANGKTIYVDGWWSDADRSEVAPPVAASAYTVYNVILGRLSARNSATQLTVLKWRDLNGNLVTPPNDTYYELCYPHGNYNGINGSASSRDVFVRGARIKRSFSDGLSTFGRRWTFANCVSEWGETMGAAITGSQHTLDNVQTRRNGGGGVWLGGNDIQVNGGKSTDNAWLLMSTTLSNYFGDVVIQGGNRNHVIGLDTERTESLLTLDTYGAVVNGGDSNTFSNLRSRGHSVGGVNVIGSTSTNTRVIDPYLLTETTPVTNTGVGTVIGSVGNTDVEVTDATKGVILKSPNGTRFRVTIGDDGALTTASL